MSSNVLVSLKYPCVHYYLLMKRIVGALALSTILLTGCVPTAHTEIDGPPADLGPIETALPQEPTPEPIAPLKEQIGTNWEARGSYLQQKNSAVYYFPRLGKFDLQSIGKDALGQIGFHRTAERISAVAVSAEIIPASGLTPGSTEYSLNIHPLSAQGVVGEPRSLHLGSSTSDCSQSWSLQDVTDNDNLAFVSKSINSCPALSEDSKFFLIDLETGAAVWDSALTGDGTYILFNDRMVISRVDSSYRCIDVRIYDYNKRAVEFNFDGVDRNRLFGCSSVWLSHRFNDIGYLSFGDNRVGYDFSQQRETPMVENIGSLKAFDPNTNTVLLQTGLGNRPPQAIIVRDVRTHEVLFLLSDEQAAALGAYARGLADQKLYLETSSEKLIIDLTIADEDQRIISTNYTRLPLISIPGYVLYDDGFIESID